MNTTHDSSGWIISEIKDQIRLERCFKFPNNELATAFSKSIGSFMCLPNLEIVVEPIRERFEVSCLVQTHYDEFLTDAAQQIAGSIEDLYASGDYLETAA